MLNLVQVLPQVEEMAGHVAQAAEVNAAPPQQKSSRSPEDLQSILLQLSTPAGVEEPRKEIKRLRDRAIVTLMANGLSVGQVTKLNVENIDLDAGLVLAQRQRSKSPLVVELGDEEVDTLRKWVATRSLLCPPTSALFVRLHWTDAIARPGERIGKRGCRQMLAGYVSSLGEDRQ
jgi:site-specific recombinase XerC